MDSHYQLEMPWESDAMEDAHIDDSSSDSYAQSFHSAIASPFHGGSSSLMHDKQMHDQGQESDQRQHQQQSQQNRQGEHAQHHFSLPSRSASFMDLAEDKDGSVSPVSEYSAMKTSSPSRAGYTMSLSIPEHESIRQGPLIASTVDTEAVPANLNPQRCPVGVITNGLLSHLWQSRNAGPVEIIKNPFTGIHVDMGMVVQHVNIHGGAEYVESHGLWAGILQRMGLPFNDNNFVSSVVSFYAKYIVPLERTGCLPIPPPKISVEKRRASAPAVTPMTPRSVGVLVATAHTDAHPTVATALDDSETTVMKPAPVAVHSPVMAVSNSVTMATSSPVAAGGAVGAVSIPTEKRLKVFRSSLSHTGLAAFRQALNSTMYVMAFDESNPLERRLRLFDGVNTLIVVIGSLHQCSCLANVANAIEYDEAHGALCPHMVWVCNKVLKVPADSNLLYQSALTTSELRQVFSLSPSKKQVLPQKPADMMLGQIAFGSDFLFGMQSAGRQDDDTCGLCYDRLSGSPSTYCASGCGKNFHQRCFQICVTSRVTKEQATCPSCHCLWKEPPMPVLDFTKLSSIHALASTHDPMDNNDATPRGLVGLPSAGLDEHEETMHRSHIHEDAYNDNFGSLLSFDMVNLPRTSF